MVEEEQEGWTCRREEEREVKTGRGGASAEASKSLGDQAMREREKGKTYSQIGVDSGGPGSQPRKLTSLYERRRSEEEGDEGEVGEHLSKSE